MAGGTRSKLLESRAQIGVQSGNPAALSVAMTLSCPRYLRMQLRLRLRLCWFELEAKLLHTQHIQGVLRFATDAR